MKRLAVLVVGMCVLIGIAPVAAKKKPRKPVIESFEATLPGRAVLALEVEEFSTDQDIKELAEAYAKGGKEAVEHSLREVRKGATDINSSRSVQTQTQSRQSGSYNQHPTAEPAAYISSPTPPIPPLSLIHIALDRPTWHASVIMAILLPLSSCESTNRVKALGDRCRSWRLSSTNRES